MLTISLYCVYLMAMLIAYLPDELDDPNSYVFDQGVCSQSVEWYGDPSLMSHRLDCSLAHFNRTHH